MAHEPVKIKPINKMIETTRKLYFDENLEKIKNKRGFVFHDFMTDKQKLVRRIIYFIFKS